MKKSIIALMLIACMLVPAMGMAAYTSGEYTAEAQGFSSAVKATVTVDGDKISAVALDVPARLPASALRRAKRWRLLLLRSRALRST